MAKKLNFTTEDEVKRASNALKDLKIEHVRVEYRHEDKGYLNTYIIVRNCMLDEVREALKIAKLTPKRIKNARHFENIAKNHDYFEPQFDCKCRQCGKTFKHRIKEAVWCSQDCRKAHREERRKVKLAEKQ